MLCWRLSQNGSSSTKLGREIFGPILPIVEVEDVDEAIQIVGDRYVPRFSWRMHFLTRGIHRSHPLVVYCFSNSIEIKEKSEYLM